MFGPPTMGGSFTCLVNWAINRIYKTLWNNSIFVHSTKVASDLRLANLIRTQAVLGFDRRLGASSVCLAIL